MSTLTLLKWKDPHGREQKFKLINRVSGKWLDFGYRLQRNTNKLEGWERECLLNADRCWCKVMSRWLKEDGTPDYPTTWKGVFCLLEDVECLEVAQDLQKALASVIPPPPPPPPPPPSLCDSELSTLTHRVLASDTTPPTAADSAELIITTTPLLQTADSAESITTATPTPLTADSAEAITTATPSPASPCPPGSEATSSLPHSNSLTEDAINMELIPLDLKTRILYFLLTFAADNLRIRF